jgi:AraC-like DNA-binding protein
MRDDVGQYDCSEARIPGFAGFAVGPESLPIGCADEVAILRDVNADLPQRARISAWREHISRLLMGVEFRPDPPSSNFDGEIVARALHDLQLLKMTFTAAQIIGGASHGEGSSYFLMHVNFDGVVAVSSMGRQLTLNEGDTVLLDGAHPFTIHRQEAGSSYVVRIPRGRMAQLVFLAETMVMRRLPGAAGLSRLFASYLDAVLLHADRAAPRVWQIGYRHVSDMLAMMLDSGEVAVTGLADPIGIGPNENRGIPAVRFQSAKSYIIEHAQEQISIRQVADRLGITERHLQRQFENHGTTFTAFLNDIRLAQAHAMLCDRDSDRLRIRSICFKTGFRDVSHFNRVFRARYGCTPAEVRKARQT